jgi:hypothetical protein
MVSSESQWSGHSNTPGLEKGNWVSQFHDNGYEPTYTSSPQLQRSMGLKPEDIPIPSIEDASSSEPHRIVLFCRNYTPFGGALEFFQSW